MATSEQAARHAHNYPVQYETPIVASEPRSPKLSSPITFAVPGNFPPAIGTRKRPNFGRHDTGESVFSSPQEALNIEDSMAPDNLSRSPLHTSQREVYGTEMVAVQVAGKPTGWAAMADDMRQYDEDKVKDCKDDIDTLMTFAGLFSAAITAFLVESYQTLQSIPMDPTSTSAPNPVSGGSPSDSLVVVNVLWFASLILSLATASFGMIIKRWLREYLAVHNPSPQARLRLRRYREPALYTWKVFEIASALPFLIQLALALFFAGLCLFTSSVHSTVGCTTTAFILSWACCVVITTLLPAFFPRCPYKTAFAKDILTFFHLRLPAFIKATNGCDEKKITKTSSDDLEILIDVDALQADDELLGTTILESIGQFHRPRLADLVRFLTCILNHRCQLGDPVRPVGPIWPTSTELQLLTDRGKKAIRDIIMKHVRYDDMPSGEPAMEPRSDIIKQAVDQDPANPFDEICVFLMSPNLQPLPCCCVQLIRKRLEHSPVRLLVALLQQWIRRFDHGRGLQLEMLDRLPYTCDLLALDFVRTFVYFCAFMRICNAYFCPPTALPDERYSWIETCDAADIQATGAFLCNRIIRELKTGPTLSGQQAEKHLRCIHRATFYICYLQSCLRPVQKSSDIQKEMSELLAATLAASNAQAALLVVTTFLEQDKQFYSQTLPYVLDGTCEILAIKSEYHIALSRISDFIPHQAPAATLNADVVERCLRLAFIALGLAPPEGSNADVLTAWNDILSALASILRRWELSRGLSQDNNPSIAGPLPKQSGHTNDESHNSQDPSSSQQMEDIMWLAASCLQQLKRRDISHEGFHSALASFNQAPSLAASRASSHAEVPRRKHMMLHAMRRVRQHLVMPLSRRSTLNPSPDESIPLDRLPGSSDSLPNLKLATISEFSLNRLGDAADLAEDTTHVDAAHLPTDQAAHSD